VKDPVELDRIKALAIPPAWTDVWICPDPNGHLQATGLDDAGRRQYIYHERWRERRDLEKFDRMLDFAAALPALRRQVTADLKLAGYPRDRVLAAAVRLLDLGFFRIGNEVYLRDNGSYGLATLRQTQVKVRGETLEFRYPAKGGVARRQLVRDPAVAKVIAGLKRRRGGGPGLFAYQEDGSWCPVRSADINAYLKAHAGPAFSAKDFRTWSATVLAASALAAAEQPQPSQVSARRQMIRNTYQQVAHYLGNTPAVCRSSYVDPRVVEHFQDGETVRCTRELARLERAVVRLLR
jgi:DNA topoisomerase IB